MGRVWLWTTMKRNVKNPYIRIPKDVMKELEKEGPGYYFVVLIEDKKDVEKIKRLLEHPDEEER